MKENFSWHSEPGVVPHWYKIHGWLPNRYLPIVMFGDSIPIYKPYLKGGHTHNHLKNMELRLILTKKEIKALRKIMKRENKNGRN